MQINPPILITGAARSGTSMTAGIIQICGAFGGETSGPNVYNRKGMFENTFIRQNIVKPYLKSIGCDAMGQDPLPNPRQVFDVDTIDADGWKKMIEMTMIDQGYTGGPWYYKGAKMCLTWYLWHLAFPQAKWIIVRRDKDAIIDSCLRTGFMRAYKGRKGWDQWVQVHESRFNQMRVALAKDSIREVWPVKMIQGDMSEIKKAIEWLGLTWKQGEIESFVDPSLYGGKN